MFTVSWLATMGTKVCCIINQTMLRNMNVTIRWQWMAFLKHRRLLQKIDRLIYWLSPYRQYNIHKRVLYLNFYIRYSYKTFGLDSVIQKMPLNQCFHSKTNHDVNDRAQNMPNLLHFQPWYMGFILQIKVKTLTEFCFHTVKITSYCDVTSWIACSV